MNILEIENLIATELEKHYADIAKRKRDGTYWIQFKQKEYVMVYEVII